MPATPIHLTMTEGAFPPLTRLSFQPTGPRNIIANTTIPNISSSKTHLRLALPGSSLSTPDRRPPFHWTRSPSPRRASARRELATAKLKSAAQAEVVRIVQPGTPETSEQPNTANSGRGALSPLTIPTRTLSFLGDYGSFSYSDLCSSSEEHDTGLLSNNRPQPISLKPSPHDRAPPAPEMNNSTERSSLHRSPILGFLNSPSSCATLNEKRSRGTSQATSSMSTVPSLSAFPSPPGSTPGPGDEVLSILSNYSTCGQPSPFMMLQDKTSVRGAETTSLNKGQASTPLPDVSSSRLHSESVGRDDMSARSRISSMKRLSRVPLGPRQMRSRPKSPLWSISQLPSV